MLNTLRQRLSLLRQTQKPQSSDESHQLRDAVITILFTLVLSDDQVDEREVQVVRKILTQHFKLAEAELEETAKELQDRAKSGVSHHKELKLIRDRCKPSQRVEVIEMCWQLAYADGNLSPDEEHLIRRLAQMLHVSHSDYIRTKLDWQSRQNSPPATSN